MARVGFIGLGNQGAPIARRIIDAGFETTLWARRPASLLQFAGTGASIASTPAALAADCDVVAVCVWDEEGVVEVVLGPDGVLAGLRRGGIIAIHSTVSPRACLQLSARAASCGVSIVDAPVSGVGGGHQAAAEGRLFVMVGGDTDAVETCRPVFETFGNPVLHLGPVGSGQLTKLVNNTLLAALIAVSDAAVDLGSSFGLDGLNLARALQHASANNPGLAGVELRLRIAEGAEAPAVLSSKTAEWARKDVALATATAERLGISTDHLLLAVAARGRDIVEAARQSRSDEAI